MGATNKCSADSQKEWRCQRRHKSKPVIGGSKILVVRMAKISRDAPRSGFKKQNKTEETPKLTKKLIITNKNPTKGAQHLCAQLRKMLSPACITKITDKHPRIQDFLPQADESGISHILLVSDTTIQLGIRPKGPTYLFSIEQYSDDLKNYGQEFYKHLPLITFDGKSPLKAVFEKFGEKSTVFKRAIHIMFDGDLIFIRHYLHKTTSTELNYKVELKEIGPKLTLKLVKTEDGLLPSLRSSTAKKTRRTE